MLICCEISQASELIEAGVWIFINIDIHSFIIRHVSTDKDCLSILSPAEAAVKEMLILIFRQQSSSREEVLDRGIYLWHMEDTRWREEENKEI